MRTKFYAMKGGHLVEFAGPFQSLRVVSVCGNKEDITGWLCSESNHADLGRVAQVMPGKLMVDQSSNQLLYEEV